jgi:hypothetical protein
MVKRLSAQDDNSTPTTNANITSGSVTGITDITVADGGTGRSTSTTAYGLLAAGTTATGVHQTISPGTSGQFLKSAGAAALASFANITFADITASTTQAIGVGSIELGHATDTTLSRSAAGQLAVEGIDVLTTSNSKTVTNKIIDGSQLVAASVPNSKLANGLIKNRQGGTTGAASWYIAGTSNTDVSAVGVFIQTGNIAVTSGNQVVTFPTAYAQIPNVIHSVSSAASVNAWSELISVTTTTCTLRVWSPAGAAVTTETVSWIAIGQ